MVASQSAAHKERIVAEARRLGFDAVAIARADLPLEADFARYESFVAKGMHGGMDWLARDGEARRRLDGGEILPGARSVICLARKYGRSAEEEDEEPELAQSIARYARGRDYHNGVRKKLRTLAKYLRRLGTDAEPVHARPLCDQEPVLERAWAARAGLGFVGKNGLLIVPGVGSLLLLGEVVTTIALEPDTPIPGRCGSCTRCLEICPTGAFVEAFVLDPRRCVAYLTIESRDAMPEPLREGVGSHLFGCDDCQTVCPFNARARAPRSHPREDAGAPALAGSFGAGRGRPSTPVDERFEAAPQWKERTLGDLLALDEAGFERLRHGTPVARATRIGLARNAAVVMGNRDEPGDLEPLARAKAGHDSAIVREAAGWALARISSRRRR